MTTIRQIFSLAALSFSLTTLAQRTLKPASSKAVVPFTQKDTTYWIYNFREFRDALYRNDKSKAKEFIDFPFNNAGNEIWYIAYSDNEKSIDNLNENVKPFSEKDFDKYFNKIFSKHLIKCLLKIRTDELYRDGKGESPEIKHDSTTYKLYVTFHKSDKTIELNLATNTPYKFSDTEYEAGESNYIYLLQVQKNGHIKLKRILIAG